MIFSFSDLFEYCASNAKFRFQCSLKRSTDLHKDFWHSSFLCYFSIWTKLSWTHWVVHNYITLSQIYFLLVENKWKKRCPTVSVGANSVLIEDLNDQLDISAVTMSTHLAELWAHNDWFFRQVDVISTGDKWKEKIFKLQEMCCQYQLGSRTVCGYPTHSLHWFSCEHIFSFFIFCA